MRDRLLVVVLATLTIGVTRQMEAEDWPTFLGPRADSKSKETGLISPWPAGGLDVVWEKELGTSYGIGSVSKGKFYQFDRHGDKARLTCMNAMTGKELWKFEYSMFYEDLYGYNNGPRCSPIVDGDRVYLYGVEGILHCLDASNGTVKWKVDTLKDFGVIQNFFGVGSTPVIEGNLIIVMIGGSPPEAKQIPQGQLDRVTGNGSGIVAFDKMTGKVAYKITDELASYASMKSATINGRKWCFAFSRGGLVGFEPSKGKIDFEYPWRAKILESVNASMPVVVGDEVFVSETYGPGSSLLKVKPGGYEIVWKDDDRKRTKAMQTHWNTAIEHQGYLYGCSGRHTQNAEMRCIEWKTGKVLWSIPALSRCSLMYADCHFVCLGEYGHLLLFKANPKKFDLVSVMIMQQGKKPLVFSGADLPKSVDDLGTFIISNLEKSQGSLVYPCWSAPILANGLMYVRGKGRLICMRATKK